MGVNMIINDSKPPPRLCLVPVRVSFCRKGASDNMMTMVAVMMAVMCIHTCTAHCAGDMLNCANMQEIPVKKKGIGLL